MRNRNTVMSSSQPCFKTGGETKRPELWRILLPTTEYISLGETLKPVWGKPALKIVDGDRVILFVPVIPS